MPIELLWEGKNNAYDIYQQRRFRATLCLPTNCQTCHFKCQFPYIAHLLYNSCVRCCQFSHNAHAQTDVALSLLFFTVIYVPSITLHTNERAVIACVKFAACLKFNTSPLSALKPLTAATTTLTVMP